MKRPKTKVILYVSLLVLTLSLVLAVLSLYPGGSRSYVLDSSFTLTPGETYMQGLGVLNGENVSITIQSQAGAQWNFTLIKPNTIDYVVTDTLTKYTATVKSDLNYNFTAQGSSYEAVFSGATEPAAIALHASVHQSSGSYPYSWLNQPAKILFYTGLSATVLAALAITVSKADPPIKPALPSLSKKQLRWLAILLLISTVAWFSLLAVNKGPLATFANWYTDNARDSYVSSLFLKDGLSVFTQPLGKLASLDNSPYKFVTWPESTHLYPLGSILVFLPFGVLIQNGVNSALVYKVEIAIFLLLATVGVYFFLKYYLKRDMPLILRLGGVYVIYVSLVFYAANGMFDSLAFLFSLFAIFMFVTERYDYFFLLFAVSFFIKYQAGIFLTPLILVAIIRLLQQNKLRDVFKNKLVVAGAVFGVLSLFTAALSAHFFMLTTPQLISNGVNIFSTNMQISWSLQTLSIFATLIVTVAYALYMLNKNALLSTSALFLLLPAFLLPYFQIWYMPYIFVYALIPQRRNELTATTIWLSFLILMLASSGANYQPIPIIAQYLQGHLPFMPSPLCIPHSLSGGVLPQAFA